MQNQIQALGKKKKKAEESGQDSQILNLFAPWQSLVTLFIMHKTALRIRIQSFTFSTVKDFDYSKGPYSSRCHFLFTKKHTLWEG